MGGDRRDHPRSRGVYAWFQFPSWLGVGSSPLARGLHRAIVGELYGDGIIPARAGFTVTSGSSAPSTTDHPRSRGVYPARCAAGGAPPGSSPLARGLRDGRPPEGGHGGIIPARAGFTQDAPVGERQVADHPRSRGVYRGYSSATTTSAGSSPLARGLPIILRPGMSDTRIIPARAGFTSASSTP